jgi:hypothetical protein
MTRASLPCAFRNYRLNSVDRECKIRTIAFRRRRTR